MWVSIPPSPQKSSKSQNINDLEDFSFKNGTNSGHNFSLYDSIMELCKEKKMNFFKPTPYINYIPPKLAQGKIWFVYFYVQDPASGKLKRIRIKINRIKPLKERKIAARTIMNRLSEQLALGWNPLLEKTAPKSFCLLWNALDTFLKVKGKEMEENSMRSYRSYLKILKEWLIRNGYNEQLYACAFTKDMALAFMHHIDESDNLSARTYNNYLLFFRSLFNWMIDKGFCSVNHFNDIKKKPKKLTKKIRRLLSDDEVSRLIKYLQDNNREYLAMCLMCYCCFMRPKEISMIKCRDVDLNKQVIHIRPEIAKNDNDSYRTIPDAMVTYLEPLDLSVPENYLFADHPEYDFTPGKKQICSRKIAKYWDHHIRPACKFSMDLQFYSLKDTGMTKMLGSGVPISLVQKQADHSSIAMTAVYVGQLSNANEKIKSINIIK